MARRRTEPVSDGAGTVYCLPPLSQRVARIHVCAASRGFKSQCNFLEISGLVVVLFLV